MLIDILYYAKSGVYFVQFPAGDDKRSLDRPAPRKPRPEGRGQGELYKNGNLPYREAPPGRAGRLHTLRSG